MHRSATSVLFPEYRRRVLAMLLLRPDEGVHGREVARRIGLPAGTVSRELTKLTEAGLLKREKRGNQQIYSADKQSPIYEELAGILRKTSGIADVLAEALAPAGKKIRIAFVFGSVAQGRETAGSDIDVLLVGDLSFRKAVELLHPVQEILGREVNPKLYSNAEFAAKARKEPFLVEVLSKPKIFLVGKAEDLGDYRRQRR